VSQQGRRELEPSSSCCVMYSRADMESWVSSVPDVDGGGSVDAIASVIQTSHRQTKRRCVEFTY